MRSSKASNALIRLPHNMKAKETAALVPVHDRYKNHIKKDV
jgi:hypothetical protein